LLLCQFCRSPLTGINSPPPRYLFLPLTIFNLPPSGVKYHSHFAPRFLSYFGISFVNQIATSLLKTSNRASTSSQIHARGETYSLAGRQDAGEPSNNLFSISLRTNRGNDKKNKSPFIHSRLSSTSGRCRPLRWVRQLQGYGQVDGMVELVNSLCNFSWFLSGSHALLHSGECGLFGQRHF